MNHALQPSCSIILKKQDLEFYFTKINLNAQKQLSEGL